MRYYKRRLSLKRFLFCFFYTLLVGIIIYKAGNKITYSTTNITNVKSIESYRIKKKENQEEKFNGLLEYISIDNLDQLELNCIDKNSIKDSLTYEDISYGNIKILITNNNLPCKSIIKMSTDDNQEFYGIVGNIDNNLSNNTLKAIITKELEQNNSSKKIIYEIKRFG